MTQKQNYTAKNIKKLEGLQAVVERPGMYIGGTDSKGYHHCMTEILDNSIDEATAGYGKKIHVVLYKDGSLSVEDEGRGIPVDMHETGVPAATLAVTELHAGGKFKSEESGYMRSGGLHGVGASVVNALSDWFEMTIKRGGNIYFQRFELKKDADGEWQPAQAVNDLHIIGTYDESKESSGTKIHFKLSDHFFTDRVFNEARECFETHTESFNEQTIRERLRLLAYLNPNLEIVFINEQIGDVRVERLLELGVSQDVIGQMPDTQTFTLSNCETLSFTPYERHTYLSDAMANYLAVIAEDMDEPVSPVLFTEMEVPPRQDSGVGDIHVAIAFQWYKGRESNIHGFANNIYTPLGGNHITGFKRALGRVLRNYAAEYAKGRLKSAFDKVSGEDILEGLAAMVAIKVAQPSFEGQTKEKLNVREAEYAVNHTLSEFFSRTLNENPQLAHAVLERCVQAKNARDAADRARKAVISEKSGSSFAMPSKLAECQSKRPEECELFLVEGDSAGGSAKMARDKRYQAIFPLKGKIINTQKIPESTAIAKQDVSQLVAILGCGVGKTFDISKLRYHKIVYLTDADVDGQHIRTLLSTFFINLFPELVKNGYVYVAISPLYRAKRVVKGKEILRYLQDDEALKAFEKEQKSHLGQWEIARFKGLGEMNHTELKETTMDMKVRQLVRLTYPDTPEEIANMYQVFEDFMGKNAVARLKAINQYLGNDIDIDEAGDDED